MATIAGLYAVTPDLLDTDELIARVTAAIAGGAAAVQYRSKIASPPLRRAQALALRDLCTSANAIFIVNDDVNLAYAVDADGVHLGRDDASLAHARLRLGRTAIIGASCYDSLERAAAAVSAGADYIAFGSFFPSTVKPDAVHAQPLLLTTAKSRWNVAVVAIGGITVAAAPGLIAAGADALAVITAVFDAPDVAGAARAFRDAFSAQRAPAWQRSGTT
ncbi:MAG: thiamine-phosphate diphosphorylase [Betaproteobacteria bacterium 13_1_40CM_4_64_4]|nr:MAG: thiamine-phosphate diphosphorylase [Betaproteobacteria bacterium 13_1_40CM_4_64_4]